MTDLAGLLVLSLEQAVAAPYASCRLADAGGAGDQGGAYRGRLRPGL